MKLIILFLLIVLNTQSLRLNSTHHARKALKNLQKGDDMGDYNFDLKDLKRLGHHQRITVNLDELMPAYKNLIQHQVDEEIEGKVDFSQLDIQEFDIDFGMEALMIPYQPTFKLGQGFDVQNGESRGSPFILSQLNEKPESIEGQDGEIKVHTITSAEQLANSLATEASLFGGGWGASMSASFTKNKQSTIKKDEVIVELNHKIELGKSYLRQSQMMFTKEARETLSQDKQEFNKQFGNYYIVGTIQECQMDIQFKKKVKKEEKKDDVAAKLKIDVMKVAGIEGKIEHKKEETQLNEQVDITIIYSGNNNKVFLTGLDLDSLQKAIIEFPKICNGNIEKYILWPYEKCQSYLKVKDNVDQTIIKANRENFLAEIKDYKPLDQITKKIQYKQQMKTKRIEKYEKYLKDQKEWSQLHIAKALLNEIFIKATILNRIISQSIEEDQTLNEKPQEHEDQIFAIKLKELTLGKYSEAAMDEFNQIIQKSLFQQNYFLQQDKKQNKIKQETEEVEEKDQIKTDAQYSEITLMIQKYRKLVRELFQTEFNQIKDKISQENLKNMQAFDLLQKKKELDQKQLTRFITVLAGKAGDDDHRLRIQQIMVFNQAGENIILNKKTTSSNIDAMRHEYSEINQSNDNNPNNGELNQKENQIFKSLNNNKNKLEFWSADLGNAQKVYKIRYYPQADHYNKQDGVRIILENEFKEKIDEVIYEKSKKIQSKEIKDKNDLYYQEFEFKHLNQ